jgi:hypothetical protein
MKNIQVIDGAENCVYDIFQASDEEFSPIFCDGRDIAFIDEVYESGGPLRIERGIQPDLAQTNQEERHERNPRTAVLSAAGEEDLLPVAKRRRGRQSGRFATALIGTELLVEGGTDDHVERHMQCLQHLQHADVCTATGAFRRTARGRCVDDQGFEAAAGEADAAGWAGTGTITPGASEISSCTRTPVT